MQRDWIIIIALGIGWGTSFFFNEMLLRDMGPLSVSLTRVGLAAVTGWCWLWLSGQSGRVPTTAYAPLAIMGTLMFGLPFAAYPLGQLYVSSSVAGIINALTPVMVVVISHVWPGGEKATTLKVLGVLAGFVGILFLTVPAMQANENTALIGTLILLLAPISYACALNWVRILHEIKMTVIATWSFTFASLLLLPLIAVTEGVPDGLQATTMLSMIALGVVLTGITFLVAFHHVAARGGDQDVYCDFHRAGLGALLLDGRRWVTDWGRRTSLALRRFSLGSS